jgi:hypothetical protein
MSYIKSFFIEDFWDKDVSQDGLDALKTKRHKTAVIETGPLDPDEVEHRPAPPLVCGGHLGPNNDVYPPEDLVGPPPDVLHLPHDDVLPPRPARPSPLLQPAVATPPEPGIRWNALALGAAAVTMAGAILQSFE